MSHSSHPTVRLAQVPRRLGGPMLALLFVTLGLPSAAESQATEPWASTADHYDGARVAAHLEQLRTQLAERHGPLAEALFAMNAELTRTPHSVETRPVGPAVPRIRHRIEASHLLHYQALQGGTLGRLHGSTRHPIGLGWLPHSMFAQSGAVFGQWGHARLLAAVQSYAERHAD